MDERWSPASFLRLYHTFQHRPKQEIAQVAHRLVNDSFCQVQPGWQGLSAAKALGDRAVEDSDPATQRYKVRRHDYLRLLPWHLVLFGLLALILPGEEKRSGVFV